MSDFDPYGDFEPEPPATLEEDRPSRRSRQPLGRDVIYNAVSLFFLGATILVCLGTLALVQNPLLPFNPFPPPTPKPTPTLFVLGTPQTGGQLADIPQPTATETPTETPTPAPTRTPTLMPTQQPTATGAALVDATTTPTDYPFVLQNESLNYTAYTGPEGCDYMAIAGQVFDLNGDPLKLVAVSVEGDEFFSALDFSGNATRYGPSGYEVFINDSPYEGDFTVKLISETGRQISEAVDVRTSSSCDENVVIVNFVQVAPLP